MPEKASTARTKAHEAHGLTVSVNAGALSVSVTPASPEIEPLVQLAKSGDRQAFATLYRTYLPTVYKFLYYRVGAKAKAEDMTAEVFLRALRKIGDFTWTGADFGAWLLRIARNLILDDAKSSRARLEMLNNEVPEEAAGRSETAESQVMGILNNEQLYRAIKQLRPDQQEVITLRFLNGMAVADVARIMNRKEGTIRTLQFRGLKALEKILVSRTAMDGEVDPRATPGGVRRSTNGRAKGRTEPEAARYGWVDGQR